MIARTKKERRVFLFIGGHWLPVKFSSLRKGEIFKLYDDDLSAYGKDISYTALCDAYKDEKGIYTIQVSESVYTVQENI